MIRLCLALFIALLPLPVHALCFFDCRPSESHARAVFEHQMRKEIGPAPYVIGQFQKTNAKDAQMLGSSFYVIDYTAEVTFPNGIRPECAPNERGQRPSTQNCLWDMFTSAGNPLWSQRVGASVTLKGSIPFEKTERGWRAPDGNLY